jgi:hypothetical protein
MKLEWHLDVTEYVDTPKYRENVNTIVVPIMDWLCERIEENDLTSFEDIECLFKQIVDELPIMRLKRRSDYNEHYVGPDFFIQYNKNTEIVFEDSASCIRREILIDNLLK